MRSIVTLGTPQLIGTNLVLSFTASGVWGDYASALSLDFATISNTQLATRIKTEVINFAAGISITLTPREIWILGLGDEQDFVRTSQDRSTNLASLVDVPDLSFKLAPNSSYKFEFEGMFTTALAATGLQLSINGPLNAPVIRFMGMIGESVTTQRYGGASAYDALIAGTNSAAATPLPFRISGSITTGADVNQALVLRARSETAGSQVTILRGAVGSLFSAA